MSNAWDQRPEETAESYAAFLTYRNLGPGRNVEQMMEAIGVQKYPPLPEGPAPDRKPRVLKSWRVAKVDWDRHAVTWEWVPRAAAWDIDGLLQAGPRIQSEISELLSKVAVKAIQSITVDGVAPPNWEAVLRTLETVAEYAPQQIRRPEEEAFRTTPLQQELSTGLDYHKSTGSRNGDAGDHPDIAGRVG